MTKEFEALRNIGGALGTLSVDDNGMPKVIIEGKRGKNWLILKSAIERLEAIDNAKPNEALECLNKIVESFNETTTGMYGLGEVVVANDLIYDFKKELETIKQTLLKTQELEKELVKYKRLEEQLGNNFSGKNNECSFEMLLEATQNGFWYQDLENKIIHLVPDDNHPIVYGWNDGYPILQYMEVTEDPIYTTQCVYDVFVTDYKKKFWLREDKSE